MTDLPAVVRVTTDTSVLPPVIKVNNKVFKTKE